MLKNILIYAQKRQMIKNYLEKLRALPDKQKKIILWIIIAVLALGLGFLWLKITISRFDKIEKSVKKIGFPTIKIEENK